MLDPRIYRAALVPILLALIVAAFALSDRPRPIGTTLAPDAFTGPRAAKELDAMAAAFPSRRPGDASDEALARRIAAELRGMGSYQVSMNTFGGETIDGDRTLTTVVARQVGAPAPGLVVVAHRDAAGRGAKAEEIDKVLGLELGADDYITKPFSLREFRSRVKAALRRAGMARREPTDEEPIEVHELRIDPAKRAVDVRGAPVQTTYVEFEILLALATSPGRVWTRDMLLTRIWGDSAYRDPRTIDVHIRHLREKLERDAKDPEYLFTVRGVGYRFRDTEG